MCMHFLILCISICIYNYNQLYTYVYTNQQASLVMHVLTPSDGQRSSSFWSRTLLLACGSLTSGWKEEQIVMTCHHDHDGQNEHHQTLGGFSPLVLLAAAWQNSQSIAMQNVAIAFVSSMNWASLALLSPAKPPLKAKPPKLIKAPWANTNAFKMCDMCWTCAGRIRQGADARGSFVLFPRCCFGRPCMPDFEKCPACLTFGNCLCSLE